MDLGRELVMNPIKSASRRPGLACLLAAGSPEPLAEWLRGQPLLGRSVRPVMAASLSAMEGRYLPLIALRRLVSSEPEITAKVELRLRDSFCGFTLERRPPLSRWLGGAGIIDEDG